MIFSWGSFHCSSSPLNSFLLSYLRLLLLLEELLVTFLKRDFSFCLISCYGSFQFFSCVFLLFEEMIVVCLFLIGELYLFTIDRWRTLSSLQLPRVIFNSCSFYTTMSFRVFYFSLLSGYHFNMSTSNGFFFLSSPCKDSFDFLMFDMHGDSNSLYVDRDNDM